MTFQDDLIRMGATKDIRNWAGDLTLPEFWEACSQHADIVRSRITWVDIGKAMR